MFRILNKLIQGHIDSQNQQRVSNPTPTLISSNCLGGFIYHWLGLRFQSPFINLFLSNEDFLYALENWGEFLSTELVEDQSGEYPYPVGLSLNGIKIHFMHYESFEIAKSKWEERTKRIDNNNLGILFSTWDGNIDQLRRFENLPFKHKIVFVNKQMSKFPSARYLAGFSSSSKIRYLYGTKGLIGKRYVDQFDYVDFINSLNGLSATNPVHES